MADLGWRPADGPQRKALAPKVDSLKLRHILADTYAKSTVLQWVGTGKAADALRNELATGQPTRNVIHVIDVADLFNRYGRILQASADGVAPLSRHDRAVAVREARELWSAMHEPDRTGAITTWLRKDKARYLNASRAVGAAVEFPATREVTGATFRPDGPGSTLAALAPSAGLLTTLLTGTARKLRRIASARDSQFANLRANAAKAFRAREAQQRASARNPAIGDARLDRADRSLGLRQSMKK